MNTDFTFCRQLVFGSPMHMHELGWHPIGAGGLALKVLCFKKLEAFVCRGFLLLVVRTLLAVRPGAPSSVLAPSSKARSPWPACFIRDK